MLNQMKTLLGRSDLSAVLRKKSPQKDQVRSLQRLLYELGFGQELKWDKFGADGDFGNATAAAVRAFAEKTGMTTDGSNISPELGRKLLEQYELSRSLPVIQQLIRKEEAGQLLFQGSDHVIGVVALQTLLHLAGFDKELKWKKFGADGDYGSATTKAIKAFAERENLPLSENGEKVDQDLLQRLHDQLKSRLVIFEMLPAKSTLRLGYHDEGVSLQDLDALLKLYHRDLPGTPASVKYRQMRNGDMFEWVDLRPVAGHPVQELQTFLVDIGIMHPESNRDGIFAYATQAGVRLFQEYLRIYEAKDLIPTGVVDPATETAIREWKEEGKTAENWPRGQQSDEYKEWMSMMKKAHQHYRENPHLILKKTNQAVGQLNKNGIQPVDTFHIDDWTFDENDIHMIGIRRKETTEGRARKNDDLFVLLINGLVFKFWGSTDPKVYNGRSDEAFLAEGQHKFRFGWHNTSEKRKWKLYQGLEPFGRGVLVFRDKTGNNRLTKADIEKGPEMEPNLSINIHWTGIGDGNRSTWSAGCQVIAGKSYIGPLGNSVDCSSFAASGSNHLKNNEEDRIERTKGAYNVFCDLLLVYPVKQVDYLIYNLGRDDTLLEDFLTDQGGSELLANMLSKLEMERDQDVA